MCCIIHRLKNSKQIALDSLEKIIKKNPHGWGLSYLNESNHLVVEKDMDMNLAIKRIQSLEEEDKEFLFHARWATHGAKNVDNCHPFKVHEGVMFHNGQLKTSEWRKEMSDTWHFSHKVSKFQKKKAYNLAGLVNNKFKTIIGESRLAFMLNTGEVVRFGTWHEIDGCFYSKLDWKVLSNWSNWDDDEYVSYYNSKYGVKNHVQTKSRYEGSNSAPFDVISQISQSAEDGLITVEQINLLSIDEITTLNQNYPTQMADFLYEQLHYSYEEVE